MRVVFFGNGLVGLRALECLRESGADVVGLVVHSEGRARMREEIVRASGLPPERAWDGESLRDPAVTAAIAGLDAEIGVSAYFGHILRPELIGVFPAGVVNLHPAYLPYNRGAYPNVWSIIDRTPAGATLHYIDAGVDTGDLIARREVPVAATDTGGSLYAKLERAGVELFRETWPEIAANRASRTPQPAGEGTSHRVSDVKEIDEIDLDATYTGRELIDLLRARTFPPHPGAYFVDNGVRVYLRLQLLTEDELADDGRGTDS